MGVGEGIMDYEIATGEVKKVAESIACKLWPIQLVSDPAKDRQGQDATHKDGRRIQIKGDQYMARSKNLYIELYEKTRDNPIQPWRVSPHLADAYISVTYGFALLVPIQAIAEAAYFWKVGQINPTSAGILIPIKSLGSFEEVSHDLWPWPPADTPIIYQKQHAFFSLAQYDERKEH